MLPYFPSSSNSWYSSVNLVQIVNAILKEVPAGCAETCKRCAHNPPHTVVSAARVCPEPANQAKGFMHSWSASARALVEWFLRQKKNTHTLTASGSIRSFRRFPLQFLDLLHSQRLVTAADAAFCVQVCVSGSNPSKAVVFVRASDAALPHLPPAVRSVPPLCLHPHREQKRRITTISKKYTHSRLNINTSKNKKAR